MCCNYLIAIATFVTCTTMSAIITFVTTMFAIITLGSTTFVITLFATTFFFEYNIQTDNPNTFTRQLYILIIVDKSVCKCKHYKYVHVSTYNVDVKKATQPYTDKTTALLTTSLKVV